MRESGIAIVGQAPWGTHLCQFYRKKAQLLEVVVPYFEAGLLADESCLWITPPELTAEEARSAVHEALPSGEHRRLYSGQLRIVDSSQWYRAGGRFNGQAVLAGFLGALRDALADGYEGLRVAGSPAGPLDRDWARCVEYEEAIGCHIGGHSILGLCAYPLDQCGSLEVVDLTRTHPLVLFPQRAGWKLI
jgi:hypothetical protein